MNLPPTSESSIPEREIVAIRTEEIGGHEHIIRVKFADGSDEPVEDTIRAIKTHEAHYYMSSLAGKRLAGVRPCPDCEAQETLYA